MADINKLLGQLLSNGAAGGFAGGLAGGLASSMLTSKKGRKLGKSAMKMGGIAAVGALAYGAYQRYNSSKNQLAGTSEQVAAVPLQAPPVNSAFLPAKNDTTAQEKLGLVLVRAMIASARSDGRLDAKESQSIFERIESLPLDPDDKSLLIEEMGHPVDMDAIVNSAKTPEIAAEVYIASIMAIDVDTAAEQSYLRMLAARLKLPQDLVIELHRQVEEQTVTG